MNQTAANSYNQQQKHRSTIFKWWRLVTDHQGDKVLLQNKNVIHCRTPNKLFKAP
jgi:hypothetical protein